MRFSAKRPAHSGMPPAQPVYNLLHRGRTPAGVIVALPSSRARSRVCLMPTTPQGEPALEQSQEVPASAKTL